MSAEPPFVSVVTVVKNAAGSIADTITSVSVQTYPHREHVIVDGVSTDGTLDIIRANRDKIARLVSEPDAGLYHAMNKGIAMATGDVIGYLNSDDFYTDPDVIADVARVMQDPAVDACYGDLLYVRPEDLDAVVRYWRSRDYQPGLVERGWMPAHPTFFIRRRILEEVKGFDARFRYQADYELMVRLFAVRGIRTRYIPRVLVKMRMGGHTNRSLRNVIRGNLEAYRACRINGIAVSPLFIVKKIASRLPQFLSRPT